MLIPILVFELGAKNWFRLRGNTISPTARFTFCLPMAGNPGGDNRGDRHKGTADTGFVVPPVSPSPPVGVEPGLFSFGFGLGPVGPLSPRRPALPLAPAPRRPPAAAAEAADERARARPGLAEGDPGAPPAAPPAAAARRRPQAVEQEDPLSPPPIIESNRQAVTRPALRGVFLHFTCPCPCPPRPARRPTPGGGPTGRRRPGRPGA